LSDMVLMIDTDVIFSPTTIHKMIHALLNKKDAIMVGSHCLGLDGGYYDSLALEMGKYHLDRQTFISHIVNYPFDLYPVSSCFGGICVTYKYVFNYCHFGQDTSTLFGYYSNMTCEHYNFCRNLKSFGNIYICKSAISYWVQNWLNESRQLLEKLKLNGFYIT
jgi:GT2 family glycosyltransferase